MIEITQGNIFESGAQALVNPVNCDGIMGAGLAKEFKRRFPDNYKLYRLAHETGDIQIGEMIAYVYGDEPFDFIFNFPTKLHYWEPSQLEYIRRGLIDLVMIVECHDIKSIAIPALGCGLGGLNWNEVRTLIENAMSHWVDVKVLLYQPGG